MPVKADIIDGAPADFAAVFAYFKQVDERFSTYKPHSEISQINAGLTKDKWSADMRRVLHLCEQTKQQTNGFFDIKKADGTLDPSGLVKGWAINNAAQILLDRGVQHFYVDAGGDIQPHGRNAQGKPWRFGIRNPFNRDEIVKTVAVTDQGVATSGTYIRGQHVYNPHAPGQPLTDAMSLTVIGPDIYQADRFATAAFAMGKPGITFIDSLPGFEGYMIDSNGTATLTRNFERYVA
ncbi:MAG TPA: FAD:protein FMN transferase [Candidatus Saccharimonas sp.]|nr:FAD:protein FMN transferase [Candidatus Saccharimonas sp.]